MLKWYYYVLFSVVTLVALSMTWWSLYDLGVTTLGIPEMLSAVLSLLLDIGGLVLMLLTIEYAKTQDSGFWVEVWTYIFIGTSTYIVVQHAIIQNYVPAGIVMFASAPIVMAVVFKAILTYLTRQSRREAGRIVEKLPSVGWFAWVRYRKQTWGLMSLAAQKRVLNAADRLDIAQDKYGIFVDTETKQVDMSQDTVPVVHATVGQPVDNDRTPVDNDRTPVGQPETVVETPKDIVLEVVPPVLDMSTQLSYTSRTEIGQADKVVLPPWLPHEPAMSVSKIVSTCMDNNVRDYGQILDIARTLKGHDVNEQTVRKSLYRILGKERGLA